MFIFRLLSSILLYVDQRQALQMRVSNVDKSGDCAGRSGDESSTLVEDFRRVRSVLYQGLVLLYQPESLFRIEVTTRRV